MYVLLQQLSLVVEVVHHSVIIASIALRRYRKKMLVMDSFVIPHVGGDSTWRLYIAAI